MSSVGPNRNLINVSSVVAHLVIVRWKLSMCLSKLAPEPPEIQDGAVLLKQTFQLTPQIHQNATLLSPPIFLSPHHHHHLLLQAPQAPETQFRFCTHSHSRTHYRLFTHLPPHRHRRNNLRRRRHPALQTPARLPMRQIRRYFPSILLAVEFPTPR